MITNSIVLSICIPTFNRASLLKTTLESIVTQKVFTQTDEIEVIVSDNFSTDNTEEIVLFFTKNYPTKIKYIRQESDIGAVKNFEVLLKKANGLFKKLSNDSLTFIDGSLEEIVKTIKFNQNEKPILFFLNGVYNYSEPTTVCSNANEFLIHVSYYSTWIGGFGLWDSDIANLSDFTTLAYLLPQTDVLYSMIHQGKRVLVSNFAYFVGQNAGRKSGYNIAEIFGKNYLGILKKYLSSHEINQEIYEAEKILLLKNHIIPFHFSSHHNFYQPKFLEYLYDYSKNDYFYTSILDVLIGPNASAKYSNLFEAKREVWQLLNPHNRTYIKNNTDITKISVGINSYGPLTVFVWDHPDEKISIGNFVSIAEDVKFLLGGEHQYDNFSTYPFKVLFLNQATEALTKGQIIVEDDVWIGYGATVLSGVTIGQGSIIGAASVVTKDVPPYSIVAGNPARVVKYRFSDEIIKKLITIDFSKITNDLILDNEKVLYEKITDENIDEIVSAFRIHSNHPKLYFTATAEHYRIVNDAMAVDCLKDIFTQKKTYENLLAFLNQRLNSDIMSTDEYQTTLGYIDNTKSKIQEINTNIRSIAYLNNPIQSMGGTAPVTRFISPLVKMDEKYQLKQLFSYENGVYVLNQVVLKESKVIIIHNDGALFDDWIPRLKEMGKIIIYALDEFYFHIPAEHPQKALKDAIGKRVINTIQQADFLMVPTKMLEQACNTYDKPVHLIASYPDGEVWNTKTPLKIIDPKEPIAIALFAEFDEKSAIKLVLPALQKIKKKYGEKVRLVIYSQTVRHELDPQITGIESYKINAPDYINLSKYIQTLPIDFYLCPVPPDPYYASKDPLSFYELSLCRLPGIFTSSLPYHEIVVNGETGIVCPNDESSWVEAMSLLIDHPALRAKLGNNAFESVISNSMVNHHLGAWDDLLTEALAISRESSLSNGSLPISLSRHDIYTLERYEAWQEIHDFKSHDAFFWDKRAQNWHSAPLIHIGCIHNSSTDLSLLADTIDSLAAQLYENWQLTVISDMASPNELFDNHPKLHWIHTDDTLWYALNEAWKDESDENWLGILRSGDRFYPHTLVSMCEAMNHHKEAKLIYSDHDEIGLFGKRENPQFKPDLNLDMLRSTNYIGDFFLIKGDIFDQIGSCNLAYMDAVPYDLLLRAYDCVDAHGILHIEDILYSRNSTPAISVSLIDLFAKSALEDHLTRNALQGSVDTGVIPSTYSITYHHAVQPLVSIIIPTKNQFDYIKPCLESILEKTTYPHYEIIVVDNGSDETEAVDFLFDITTKHPDKIKLIPYLEPFNYSRANNIGAHHAQGEYLFLLNNDTIIIQDDWLEKLLSFGQRDDVGIVGARLLYPIGTIQHAGVIIGLGGLPADHHFIHFNGDESGYMNRLVIDQNYSAVTAAALLIKTDIFHSVNGFNEIDYQVSYSDVDLCLKVKDAGYNIVWTPHVTLIHHGSVSHHSLTLSQESIDFKSRRFEQDKEAFTSHWSHLYRHESAFNRHLDMKNQNVVINIEESVPWGREENALTKIWAMPRAYDGGGEYRILSPMRAIHSHGLALAHTAWHYIDRIDIHRANPDVWLLQTPLHNQQIDFINKIRASSKGLIIFEIDDLLTNIPIGNNAFFTKYHDMDKRLPKAIKMCDRLIVSTQPLADIYGKYSQDVRIVPNYLDGNKWRHLISSRRNGSKPRVGWAGGISHLSDLEIISKVVIELSNEIDWVFFGMCPEEMLPYVHEYHTGISLDDYPAKLASMDLDLALAPLETNTFNEAKSHLRLLEYGIMGWPIIATDIYPYQGDAPITRVKNRYTDWKKAIQEKLRNREALALEGDAMREWVLKNWMIEDHIEDVLPHYLP